MAKIEPWHPASTAFTTGESAGGGEDAPGDGERVYHDNDACEEGNKIPKVQRAIGTGKDRKHCPTCAGLG